MASQCPQNKTTIDEDAAENVAASQMATERKVAIGCLSLLVLAALILFGIKIGSFWTKDDPPRPFADIPAKWRVHSSPTLFSCFINETEGEWVLSSFGLEKNHAGLSIIFAGSIDRDISKPWTLSAGGKSFPLEMKEVFTSVVSNKVPDALQETLVRALDGSTNTVLEVPLTNGRTTVSSFDTHGVPLDIFWPREAP